MVSHAKISILQSQQLRKVMCTSSPSDLLPSSNSITADWLPQEPINECVGTNEINYCDYGVVIFIFELKRCINSFMPVSCKKYYAWQLIGVTSVCN